MKAITGVLLVAVAFFALTCTQKEPPRSRTSGTDEAELLGLERAVGEAITRRDTAALNSYLADDFLAINPLGVEMGKAEVLAQAAAPEFQLESLRNEEIRVRVFGDCAVANAVGTAKGRIAGKDASARFRYMRVWLKREGRWQAVAAHAAPLPPL